MYKDLLSKFPLFKGSLVVAAFFFILLGFLHSNPTEAAGTVYYFNNAINTNPNTLGNYWLNAGHTVHAVILPDLSVDQVNILSGATYNGNAVIRGSATNEGNITGTASFYDQSINDSAVSGNVTFYGNESEDFGFILGNRTRRYTASITPVRNFFNDGAWNVMADGAIVNLTGSAYNGTTTFSQAAGGYFTNGSLVPTATTFFEDTVTITFGSTLNGSSLPLAADFAIRVNNTLATINDVDITGTKVILTLDNALTSDDLVDVTYTVNSAHLILASSGLNADSFSQQSISARIPTGDAPVYSTLVGTKLYVSNNHGSSVTVIDTVTDTVITTITVGDFPEFSVAVGNKLYVNNLHGDSVSVINTLSDTVTSTITVGDGPYFSTVVGTTIYVSNTDTNTISVINTNTDTVTTTITVGGSPWYSGVVGTKLYVPNRGGNTVSIINTLTNTVIGTLTPPTINSVGTRALVVGTKVYVGEESAVSVINSQTDTITSHIDVGDQPYFSCAVGTKVYIVNRASSSITVVNALTDAVLGTITVAANPTTCVVMRSKIYVTRDLAGSTVEIIDTATDTVIESITVGTKPFYATPVNDKLYVSNNTTNDLSVINTTATIANRPNLISFSSSTPDDEYAENDVINITATFGQNLNPGSNLTVLLSTGASVNLSSVSGDTISGTYTVGADEFTPDLVIRSITSASVTNTSSQTRTSYSLPSSVGNLVAENSFITRNLGDSHNIKIGPYISVPVGNRPYQISTPITVSGVPYSYVANQGAGTVSVVRTTDDTVTGTIPVGSEPYGLATAVVSGVTYVYVANTGSNTVSVINTATNTVATTIAVGVEPYYVAAVGTKIYVTNSQSNSVSAINALTNTVTATIPVGIYPRALKAHGTDLYVANYGDPNYSGGDSVSIIDSNTNTVSGIISLPVGSAGARGLNVLGSKVYVANFRSHNVSVIDTATNTITATVAVGNGPRGIIGLGSKVYVENFDDGTMSVIDTNSNTVTATVDIGHSPSGMAVSGTDIYLTRFQDSEVSIFNSLTNTLHSTPPAILSLTTSSITSSGATINVSTDKATTVTVDYGLTSSYGDTASSLTLATSHQVALSNLTAQTIYHYQVTVTDSEGNSLQSSDQTFTTVSGGGSGGGGGGIIFPTPPPISNGNNSGNPTADQNNPNVENNPDSNLSQGGSGLNNQGGKIFLAVEDRGRMWYVYSRDGLRYEITRAKALDLFRKVALGITNKNLNLIPLSGTTAQKTSLSQRLKNLFLLQVENRGQTWYVDQNGYRHMVTASTLMSMSEKLATGILNKTLNKVLQAR